MGYEVHKHCYAKANETSFRECPTFCRRQNWHDEGEIIYYKDLSSDVFDDGTK